MSPRLVPAPTVRWSICVLTIVLVLTTSPSMVWAWTPVADGIDYQYFQLPDPNNVFVARMSRHNNDAFIESSLAYGRIDGSYERMSSQFSRYNDAINYWGQDWGGRNQVVVAINGDYSTGGIPLEGQIQGGWHIKAVDGYAAHFGWTQFYKPIAGGGVWQYPRVRYHTGATQFFDDINVPRGQDELIIYTNHYGANSKTDNTGVEVLVEMMRPAGILPSDDAAKGIVRQIRANQGSTSIPFDHIVLSATGTAATTLLNNAVLGEPIYISQQIMSTYHDWTRAYSAVGGLGLMMSGSQSASEPMSFEKFLTADTDGGATVSSNVVAPRSAVAYNRDYIFFVVVDGRSTESIGMEFYEVAEFCSDVLGATDGISLDGGGSSTLVVNGQVMNNPSDPGGERAIPNGLLMVLPQPKVQSTSFNAGDTVRTTTNTTMYTGPGTNYLSLVSLSANHDGTILDHSLRGVYAKGLYWWKCQIDGYEGWVSQNALTLTSAGNLPVFTQHPADTHVCPADDATFEVAATGTGTLTYQWQFHGADIVDDGRRSGTVTPALTIQDVTTLDAGAYRCRVTDDVGTVTSYSAALFVNKPTVVSGHPQDRTAYPLGGVTAASFSVFATGEGALTYQWLKDDDTVLTDDGYYAGTATATLSITNVDSRHAGTYRCRVTGVCGDALSDQATLTVVSSDLDGDEDADMDDMALLQNCLGMTDLVDVAPECAKADLTADSQVRTTDVSAFRSCLSGPGIPLPPGC